VLTYLYAARAFEHPPIPTPQLTRDLILASLLKILSDVAHHPRIPLQQPGYRLTMPTHGIPEIGLHRNAGCGAARPICSINQCSGSFGPLQNFADGFPYSLTHPGRLWEPLGRICNDDLGFCSSCCRVVSLFLPEGIFGHLTFAEPFGSILPSFHLHGPFLGPPGSVCNTGLRICTIRRCPASLFSP